MSRHRRVFRKIPKIKVHPDLKRAVRADGRGLVQLAALAGYPAYTVLSNALRLPQITFSDLNVTRLRSLAAVVGYAGPVLKEKATASPTAAPASEEAML